jgi:hypothetical protein
MQWWADYLDTLRQGGPRGAAQCGIGMSRNSAGLPLDCLPTDGWPDRRYSLHNRQRSPTSTMDAQKPLVLTRT